MNTKQNLAGFCEGPPTTRPNNVAKCHIVSAWQYGYPADVCICTPVTNVVVSLCFTTLAFHLLSSYPKASGTF